MFKSVFLKYISAFMIIMILSFVIVAIVTSVAIGRFSSESKQDMMHNIAEITKSYLISSKEDGESIKEFVEKQQDEIIQAVELLSNETENITVLITDDQGKVLLCTGSDDNIIDTASFVSNDILTQVFRDGEYSSIGSNDGIFENMKAVYAIPVDTNGENDQFSVFVCSDSIMMEELWTVIFRVVMGSVIWVLLAALIAVYFISERVVAPLREISAAAKKFASGKFDVRVPVRGSDEVAELAMAFNNMAESLDNYDNMRNTFMSDVSHDLRSPMTSISGFIDGILDGVIPPDQHKYYLQIVSSEIKRLSRLVSSLLDLSRIQAGDRKFTMVSFDVCEMARQILISFEQKIDAKKIEVEFDIQEEKLIANADSDAIHQVLYNLCDNAVKFSSEGGKLRVAINKIKGKKLLVEVYNEGKGIDPKDINYVFERFYKSDKSRGLNKTGAGLGLFIAKTIMDAHDQKIWVESEYGKNCCFRFTLDSE